MKLKCHNCGSTEFTQKKVDEVFNVNGKLYFIKNINAFVCSRCDEKYFTPEVQEETMKVINKGSNLKKVIEAEVYEMI